MCLRVGGWLHMMSRHGQIEAHIAGKYSVAPRHLSKPTCRSWLPDTSTKTGLPCLRAAAPLGPSTSSLGTCSRHSMACRRWSCLRHRIGRGGCSPVSADALKGSRFLSFRHVPVLDRFPQAQSCAYRRRLRNCKASQGSSEFRLLVTKDRLSRFMCRCPVGQALRSCAASTICRLGRRLDRKRSAGKLPRPPLPRPPVRTNAHSLECSGQRRPRRP